MVPLMARRAVIVGGTGQIGRACGRNLAQHGWDVVALSRGEREVPDDLDVHGIEHRTIDREAAGALRAALGGDVDVLIDVVAFNAEHAAQLLELDGQVGSVVAISSASVYADALGRTLDESVDEPSFPELPVPIPETQTTVPPGPKTYSTLKVALEQALLEQHVVPATVLRPCAIHGPGALGAREWWVIGRALDKRPYVVLACGGGTTFHPTSTANLAELVRLAGERPASRVLNCGDPDPPDVRTLVGLFAAAVDYQPVEVLLPGNPQGEVGASPWTAPRPFVLDMTAAERDLGYRPVVGYAGAVQDTARWLLEHVNGHAWQDALPPLAQAAEAIFPYQDEDAVIRELLGEAGAKR
jgi:nucleoside-diphosphate-sugar epimerase